MGLILPFQSIPLPPYFAHISRDRPRPRQSTSRGELANKMARMAWPLLAHGGTYRARGDVTALTNCRVMKTLMRNGRDRRSENPSLGSRRARQATTEEAPAGGSDRLLLWHEGRTRAATCVRADRPDRPWLTQFVPSAGDAERALPDARRIVSRSAQGK
jgi:hypothetical protein